MPETNSLARKKLVRDDGMPPAPIAPASYVELGVTTPFSFLRGASDAIELVLTALGHGMDAIGVADRNTLAGRGADAQRGQGRGIAAADRVPDRPGRLPVAARLPARPRGLWAAVADAVAGQDARRPRANAISSLSEVALHAEGIALIAMPGEDLDAFEAALPAMAEALPGMRHVAAAHFYRGDDLARIERLDRLAKRHALSILATNDVHYHAPEPPPAAGRDELHPREGHAGQCGISAQPQRRAASEIAGRDGAAVRALAACDPGDARGRRQPPLQPRRIEI